MFWFALPPLVYLGLCGLMYARQRDLVYCPHETRVAADQTDFALVHDGVTLRGWVVNPGRQQALIYFGGNAEPVQVNRERFTRWFPEHTVYLMAYRGFGASEGEPTEAGITSDALALFDHVERLHPDSGIDVIGRSLGSGVAAHVAARRPVRRLALVTPYDTLADVGQAHYRWLPIHLLARERYDSVSNLSRYTGPILVVRAGQDTVIPAANTQRLINSLPRPPKVLQLRTADHSSIAFAPALARTMKLFFATPGYGGVAKVSRKSPTVRRPRANGKKPPTLSSRPASDARAMRNQRSDPRPSRRKST
jgi:fermentation-respiration switch protein FrsA (DUF1100 family)